MEDLHRQIDFILETEKLKTVKRQNMTLDNGRPENSAEHSWHLAVMALVLFETAGSYRLDRFRVIKMLLVHDLAEIYAGDTWLFDDEERENAAVKEKTALEKLLGLLPEVQADELMSLWGEFETGKSAEAQFARSLDALQPLLTHLRIAPDGFNPWHLKAETVLSKKRFIEKAAPALWPLVEQTVQKSIERGLYEE